MTSHYYDKSDRDLLVDIHGTVERLDERTQGMPEKIDELQVAVAGHDVSIRNLNRGMIGGFMAMLAAATAAVAKFVTGQ